MTSIVWFRRDLRRNDNPALDAAIARGKPVVPVFILDDADAGPWAPGGASRWWLAGSLACLAAELAQSGSGLVLRRGPAEREIGKLVAETGAESVFWNRRYEPWAVARDMRLKASLAARGINVKSFNASLLMEPWTLETKTGGPYRVFTPFYTALRERLRIEPLRPAPQRIAAPESLPPSDPLAGWSLSPTTPDWAGGLKEAWTPGVAHAMKRLARFLHDSIDDYATNRDRPAVEGTSRLSPHLHFGEVGPRQIWHAVASGAQSGDGSSRGAERFLSELAWREFSYHLLYHFPHLPDAPLKAEFAQFCWSEDASALRAWQRGLTGYPIVDAGMRELWATGWMHNRVRMIVASFLVKDLLLSWRAGEAWFWDTLVDADLANNAASWQWVAGCGADAAPYFRVFNPVLQGRKFDPDGAYVRRWVPELATLGDAAIHAPWTARPVDLLDAGIAPGRSYPQPIVDHLAARDRALRAYRAAKDRDRK